MAIDDATGRVTILPQAEPRLTAGHRWVFDRDVASVSGAPQAGEVVEVVTPAARRLVGLGLYSPQSKIRVRVLAGADERIDDTFWSERLRAAVALRARTVSGATAYRLVNADGDRLPGLIVDRYGDTLVLQSLTAGMDRRQETLADLLLSLSGTRAVFLRNDAPVRTLEGLPLERRFLRGEGPTKVEIREGPGRFVVDLEHGQKTGWFCDQRENRLVAAAMARGKDVLDAFCHTGGFSVQAAVAGARSVAGLDASRAAIEQARAHAALNEVSGVCDFRTADATESLKRLGRSRKRFDLLIVDPPAFAKRRAARDVALEGYRYVNTLALPLVRSGGMLVSCSCSHHVEEADLCAAVEDAARRARRRVQVLERRGAGPDHPIVEAMPETRYLTCLLVTVV